MKNRNIEHKDDWATPKAFYEKLDLEFGFDFDPCPFQCDTSSFDGLKARWGGANFVNPPYSLELKTAFVKKGVEESRNGKLCVFLLPVSTSTKLFHEEILPHASEIRFLKGRLKFSGFNTKGEFVSDTAGMHDSMVVVFKPFLRKEGEPLSVTVQEKGN